MCLKSLKVVGLTFNFQYMLKTSQQSLHMPKLWTIHFLGNSKMIENKMLMISDRFTHFTLLLNTSAKL